MNKIINNKQTDYVICYSKDASRCVRKAAEELSKYLYYSTDCLIPIHSDKCEKRCKEIYIGNCRNLELDIYNEELKDKSKEAFIIKIIGDDILFYSFSDRGILYSVYYFLDHFINLHCYHKDEIDYDKVEDVIIKDDMLFDFPFEYRDVYYRDAFDEKFSSMNMLNSSLASLGPDDGGKMEWYNFHHSFSDLINPNDYFNTHPEYFSLIDGKRRKEHTELCLSNPEVLNLVIKKVKEWIVNNPEKQVFSVSQDEWMGHFIKMACECENCKRIDNYNESQSGSIINFVNKVSEEIKKEYPDKLIHTFAYQYSRHAPKHVKPNDNVIVRLCNIECSWNKSISESIHDINSNNYLFYQDLVNWSKICNRLYIWDYATNFRNYLLPFPNIRSMIKNIELYKKMHVKGLLMQGNFSFGGKGYLDELKAYLISRYMKYDNLNLDEEIKDFCSHYYGPYASIVIEYLNLFEDNIKDFNLWLYDDSDAAYFNDELIEKAHLILNKEKLINNRVEKYINRYECFKLNYDYLYISRLPLDDIKRNKLIDEFILKVKKHHLTELFERTDLEYSFNVLRKSRYCKERNNWVNLYYIMK